MIDLTEKQLSSSAVSSSKGDQLKWLNNDYWYKADKNGYEGLSEYITSKLLEKSSLNRNEFVSYKLEQIKYKSQVYNGCKSKNFLCKDDKIITLERLYQNTYGSSLTNRISKLDSYIDRAQYLVTTIENLTGLHNFGEYLYKVLVIDAMFLNEDRHLHNIAVILKADGKYDYCPIFDNGACLLSDTSIDYPLKDNVLDLISSVEAKTIGPSFMQAMQDLEQLYGTRIEFMFNNDDVDRYIDEISIYDNKIKKRVKQVIKYRMNQMKYYF